MTLLQKCEHIATTAHLDQFRFDGKTPYIAHPAKVASMVHTDEQKCVAWLHDVLEDTRFTVQQLLAANISAEVVRAVTVLTKSHNIDYLTYLAEVKQNKLARSVKIADMLANLSDSPTRNQVKKYAAGLTYLLGFNSTPS